MTSLDTDEVNGCIRSVEHAYTTDGGLAVLHGNIAVDGCVVKTAGVPENQYVFRGPAAITESQEEAVEAILSKRIKAGDVVVVRYEAPRAARACRRCSTPPAT